MRTLIITAVLSAALACSAAEYVDTAIAATFKVFNPASTGTGVVLNAGTADKPALVLLTAAHCFEKMKGDSCLLVLRKRQDNGGFSRHDVTVPIRKDGNPLWHKLEGQDLAVIRLRLKKDEAAMIKPLPLSALASADSIATGVLGSGDATRMLGYPTQFESNGAGLPIIRQAVVASHPVGPVGNHHTFLLDVTTFAGDSGGPVIIPSPKDAARPLLVGIVLAQHFHDEKVKVSLREEKVVKHQLGLAIVLHADFARQAIKKLK